MQSPDDPQIPGLIAKLVAYLKKIEQNEEQRRRTLEERIANMAQAAEDLLRAECDGRLAPINSTESQQLEKLYPKMFQITYDLEKAKVRDASLVVFLATGVAEDIRDRRKHRSAGRLPRLTYEQLQEEQAYAEGVVCQIKDALRLGTEAREERSKEEYERLQGECQEIAVRAEVQRQKILGEMASKRKSKLEQHERLAARLRSEEEPSVLKKHMNLVHGLEAILLRDPGDQKSRDAEEAARKTEDQRKREQDEQAARDKSARREREREQQEAEDKAQKEKDTGEERKRREETEAKNRGRRSQSYSTRSTHSESTGEDQATRGIKHAWSLYASFAERFKKRHDHRLTFADIAWPVYLQIVILVQSLARTSLNSCFPRTTPWDFLGRLG